MSPNLDRSPVERLMKLGCFFPSVFFTSRASQEGHDTGQTNRIQGIIRLFLMMSASWHPGLFTQTLHSSQLRGLIYKLQCSSVLQQLKKRKSPSLPPRLYRGHLNKIHVFKIYFWMTADSKRCRFKDGSHYYVLSFRKCTFSPKTRIAFDSFSSVQRHMNLI